MNNEYQPTIKLRAECACLVNCREYQKGEYIKTSSGRYDRVFRSVKAAIKAKFAMKFGNYDTITIEHVA